MIAYQDSLKSEKTPYDAPMSHDTMPAGGHPHKTNNGKFGCIPRAWLNLDATNRFHFKPWFGRNYIYFDHAFMHDPEIQDSTLKDDVYLLASQDLLNAWNHAISDPNIDNSQLQVGVCSDLYQRNNMKIFDHGAVFVNKTQLYPPLSTCDCYSDCD